MKKILFTVCCFFVVTACSDVKTESPDTVSAEEMRRESRGKLTGEEGISFGGGSRESASSASPLGVNSFLWRATIDTISFMPLLSADPFGGVIITDWYEDPKAKGERYKINAIIMDKSLRADGIKITLFKQELDKRGVWRDKKVNDGDARKIEDTILTRARELKIRQGK